MAQLNCPYGVFVSNGEVFICDTENHRVRKVLRNGQIVTIAGTGIQGYNGECILATDAQLNSPYSVFVSSSNQVYISEFSGQRIRKIDSRGIISTIAGTGEIGYNRDFRLATTAKLFIPCGLFVTEDEQVLFADYGNRRVRKINRRGLITTIAGSGKRAFSGDGKLAINASLDSPTSVFQYKHEIYIADSGNSRIRKIDQQEIITTVAENTVFAKSVFICKDEVYFTDSRCLFKVLFNGIIKTIAGIENEEQGFNGDDMLLATQCKLHNPNGIFIDMDSQIYIADTDNHCIRRIDRKGMMRTIVGTPGDAGYSGDVPFDFQQYPHIGPRKKQLFNPFPHAYHDILIVHVNSHQDYEPLKKKVKY